MRYAAILLIIAGCSAPRTDKVRLGATCATNADCGDGEVCDASFRCVANETPNMQPTFAIGAIGSDLTNGIVASTLIVGGTGFTVETTATMATAGQTFALAPIPVSSAELRLPLPSDVTTLVTSPTEATSFTLEIANGSSKVTRTIDLSKGDPGEPGPTPAAQSAIDSIPHVTVVQGGSGDGFVLTSSGSGNAPLLQLSAANAPALVGANSGTGLSLRAKGKVDLSQNDTNGVHAPFYPQALGNVTSGGLGVPSANPNTYPGDLSSDAEAGVAYCLKGDAPISGGCVVPFDSCSVTVSAPVLTPTQSGHRGWKCRVANPITGSSDCQVTVTVMCLKGH